MSGLKNTGTIFKLSLFAGIKLYLESTC